MKNKLVLLAFKGVLGLAAIFNYGCMPYLDMERDNKPDYKWRFNDGSWRLSDPYFFPPYYYESLICTPKHKEMPDIPMQYKEFPDKKEKQKILPPDKTGLNEQGHRSQEPMSEEFLKKMAYFDGSRN